MPDQPDKNCPNCGGTGKLTPADMAACSDPSCCFQEELDCPCKDHIVDANKKDRLGDANKTMGEGPKRYSIWTNPEEDSLGGYVRFDDYLSLEKELSALKEKSGTLARAISDIVDGMQAWAVKTGDISGVQKCVDARARIKAYVASPPKREGEK